jgi:ketosteroid isomerase-like protein
VQDLQDRHDIAQVIVRYATSVDQRDLERYATCFTPDVEVHGFSGGAFTDRDVYVKWVAEALSRFAGTHHQITNQEITVDGDTAHMRSYVQATHVMADDPDSLLILWAIYDDRLVRGDDGWVITRHELERLIEPRLVPGRLP